LRQAVAGSMELQPLLNPGFIIQLIMAFPGPQVQWSTAGLKILFQYLLLDNMLLQVVYQILSLPCFIAAILAILGSKVVQIWVIGAALP
jgi:hypothetical protein